MVKKIPIECLACGKIIKLPQYIDKSNYDGELICQECKSRLNVKLIKGKVVKYKIIEKFKPDVEPIHTTIFHFPDGTRMTPKELREKSIEARETEEIVKDNYKENGS